MLAMVGPAISLATSICNLINTEEALKYINQLKQLESDLIAEDAKGDDADDGKIESLHKQIAVTLQAVNSQYALSKGGSAAPSASS